MLFIIFIFFPNNFNVIFLIFVIIVFVVKTNISQHLIAQRFIKMANFSLSNQESLKNLKIFELKVHLISKHTNIYKNMKRLLYSYIYNNYGSFSHLRNRFKFLKSVQKYLRNHEFCLKSSKKSFYQIKYGFEKLKKKLLLLGSTHLNIQFKLCSYSNVISLSIYLAPFSNFLTVTLFFRKL